MTPDKFGTQFKLDRRTFLTVAAGMSAAALSGVGSHGQVSAANLPGLKKSLKFGMISYKDAG